MLAEIELDVLHWLDRAALEGLQVHSRYLRDTVNRHVRTLPLRFIHWVDISYGHVYMQLLEKEERILQVREENGYETLVHGVNNAYIRRLALSFRQPDLVPLCCLRTKAKDLQCQIGTLVVQDSEEEIDDALLDFLAVHLKPQVYEAATGEFVGLRESHAMLFARSALHGYVKHLVYWAGVVPAPDCVFPNLFGIDVVESCAIWTLGDPSPWIGNFIKIFETAERGTDIVRSITLIHEPLMDRLHTIDALGQPRRTDAPTPRNAFVELWLEDQHFKDGFTESSGAEHFVFENAKAAKKLEVFMWTIAEVNEDEAQTGVNNVFLLQVLDM